MNALCKQVKLAIKINVSSRPESNWHHLLRREISYPLNDERKLQFSTSFYVAGLYSQILENLRIEIFVVLGGISPYGGGTGFRFSHRSEPLENNGEPFRFLHARRAVVLLSRTRLKKLAIKIKRVLSAGIEPASPPSQGDILSIERQEEIETSESAHCEKRLSHFVKNQNVQ